MDVASQLGSVLWGGVSSAFSLLPEPDKEVRYVIECFTPRLQAAAPEAPEQTRLIREVPAPHTASSVMLRPATVVHTAYQVAPAEARGVERVAAASPPLSRRAVAGSAPLTSQGWSSPRNSLQQVAQTWPSAATSGCKADTQLAPSVCVRSADGSVHSHYMHMQNRSADEALASPILRSRESRVYAPASTSAAPPLRPALGAQSPPRGQQFPSGGDAAGTATPVVGSGFGQRGAAVASTVRQGRPPLPQSRAWEPLEETGVKCSPTRVPGRDGGSAMQPASYGYSCGSRSPAPRQTVPTLTAGMNGTDSTAPTQAFGKLQRETRSLTPTPAGRLLNSNAAPFRVLPPAEAPSESCSRPLPGGGTVTPIRPTSLLNASSSTSGVASRNRLTPQVCLTPRFVVDVPSAQRREEVNRSVRLAPEQGQHDYKLLKRASSKDISMASPHLSSSRKSNRLDETTTVFVDCGNYADELPAEPEASGGCWSVSAPEPAPAAPQAAPVEQTQWAARADEPNDSCHGSALRPDPIAGSCLALVDCGGEANASTPRAGRLRAGPVASPQRSLQSPEERAASILRTGPAASPQRSLAQSPDGRAAAMEGPPAGAASDRIRAVCEDLRRRSKSQAADIQWESGTLTDENSNVTWTHSISKKSVRSASLQAALDRGNSEQSRDRPGWALEAQRLWQCRPQVSGAMQNCNQPEPFHPAIPQGLCA